MNTVVTSREEILRTAGEMVKEGKKERISMRGIAGACGIAVGSLYNYFPMPEFVTREEFDWAVREATAKKKKDFSKVEFFTYDEGLCVQCMHLGSYDDEPETLARMNAFAAEQGYAVDFSETRFHHELYLSDPNRTAPEKRKTILRHPLKSSL